jgi:hypothetical protein
MKISELDDHAKAIVSDIQKNDERNKFLIDIFKESYRKEMKQMSSLNQNQTFEFLSKIAEKSFDGNEFGTFLKYLKQEMCEHNDLTFENANNAILRVIREAKR